MLRGEEDAPRKNPSSSISLSLPSWNRLVSGKSLARAFASQKRRLQPTLLCSVLTPRAAAASLGQRCCRRRAVACTRAGEAKQVRALTCSAWCKGAFSRCFAHCFCALLAHCCCALLARCVAQWWLALLRARDRPSGGSALSFARSQQAQWWLCAFIKGGASAARGDRGTTGPSSRVRE